MSSRTRVRRLPEKAITEQAVLHAILDEAVVAHIGIVDQAQPYVLPMACARDGDHLLVHGSTGSRLMRLMAEGAPVCATVTLLDGMVLARSAFNSSMHYRSALIMGVAEPVADAREALRILTEHLLPGRWDVLREPTRKELAATLVLALPLREWSVKVSDSPPEDEAEDLDEPVWAGVIPLRMTQGTPVPAPDLRFDLPAPVTQV
jgi:nitroimidazol reductase NimA-like FMN-containing flavoprotein (pyridoxamine 5'-phosphate oxidase superfamily)